MPSTKGAQKVKITRIRSNSVKEPTTLENIEIPENLKYIEGELFVLRETDFTNEKNIILGTRSSLKLLEESSCWLMDGTFHVVPSIMTQLFSIHGYIEGTVVPLVFCIMSRKTKEAYLQFFWDLFNIACEWEIQLNPKIIVSDFEKGIFGAAKEFFPYCNFKGCLFHFGQIIWRTIQKLKLSTKYGVSEEFGIKMRMLKSLAFVPSDRTLEYFNALYVVC